MAKRRWARLAWALACEGGAGLAHFGYLLVAVSPHLLDGPAPATATRPRQAQPPDGPPQGHPERLAAYPLSAVERGLWAQLD
ncbi:MAG TPA: DUF6059 family protein [Micromonosporaceae bacterium]|nr:DUF6059 family protein [Micromonosporaceae bacterium]